MVYDNRTNIKIFALCFWFRVTSIKIYVFADAKLEIAWTPCVPDFTNREGET